MNGTATHSSSNPPPGYPVAAAAPPPQVTTSSSNTVTYAQYQLGVSIYEEKKKAIAQCKAMVERIVAQCRRKNRRFRDIEFDVENDRSRCLHNLTESKSFVPQDTRRITELTNNNPVFYSGGKRAAEVVQGAVEDCYFVSALSGLTSKEELVWELCVARDEEIGVYGFLFYRDCYWVPVVVDDIVFTRIPKFEMLTTPEKELYDYDKAEFNASARAAIDSLYFAKAGKTGETWVPLVEKAFAKFNGDYASVMYGRTCDALEDITGGVSTTILCKDILDADKFWKDELLYANKDRVFAVWFKSGDGGLVQPLKSTIQEGLVANLSHSVVRAVEIHGKRFVVIRDPWGEPSWKGPWSDGSKEWTGKWREALPELGHDFSSNGQFVMEYSDFLTTWQEIQRTLIFDESWKLSSQWLFLPEKPDVAPWNYGDFSFSFSLSTAARTVISFTKVAPRFFKDIQGAYLWNMDFVLTKEGESEIIAESSYSFFYTRSVSLELELEPGNYTVLPRLEPLIQRDKDYFRRGVESGWDRRKLLRAMTQRAQSWSIAANYKPDEKYTVKSAAEILAGGLPEENKSAINALKTYGHEISGGSDSLTVSTTTTTQTVIARSKPQNTQPPTQAANFHPMMAPGYLKQPPPPQMYYPPAQTHYPNHGGRAMRTANQGWEDEPHHEPPVPVPVPQSPASFVLPPPPPPPPLPPLAPLSRSPSPVPIRPLARGDPLETLEDDNALVVGLKVFTQGMAVSVITGSLKAKFAAHR
ncbi:hypothetical protein H1R20_g863, partial [Candolleomyces eurysporus]